MRYRFDIEQNSDEWHQAKLGKFSASKCAELLMDKNTKGYAGLIAKIVEERITGSQCENDTFKGNWATERGHQFESEARADYEMRTLTIVDTVGIVELDEWVVCSPDGLIGENKLHQIKCPIFSTQKEYLRKGKIPSNYYKQIQFELFVTNRSSSIFTSFHPYLKAFDYEVFRDEEMITFISQRIKEAKKEVLEEIKYLNSL